MISAIGYTPRQQRGLSLVELLVAMVIGIVILLAASEVMVSNRRRNRHGLELGYMRGGWALGSSALEERNVGAVNNEGASGVLRSNGAVAEVITFEDTLEIGFRGSP